MNAVPMLSSFNNRQKKRAVKMSYNLRRLAIWAVCGALVASGVNAKSKFGIGLSDPIVQPLYVFRETIQQISVAPTLVYGGVTFGSQVTAANGSYREGSCVSFPLSSRSSKFSGGITLGARRVADNGFFLGGEVFLNAPSGKQTAERPIDAGSFGTAVYTQTLKLGPEIGAKLVAGYQVDNIRWYMGVGASGANASVSMTNMVAPPGGAAIAQALGESKRTLVGTNFSIGMEYDISSDLTMRGEMTRVNLGGWSYGALYNSSHAIDVKDRRLSLGLFLRK